MGLLARIERAYAENPEPFRGHVTIWSDHPTIPGRWYRAGSIQVMPGGTLGASGDVPDHIMSWAEKVLARDGPGDWWVVHVPLDAPEANAPAPRVAALWASPASSGAASLSTKIPRGYFLLPALPLAAVIVALGVCVLTVFT